MQHTIRLATAADLPAIHRIYEHYVKHSTCTFQIDGETIRQREQWFADHGDRHPVTVCVDASKEIVGWASLSTFNRRGAYDTTAEVSVYIDHHRHNNGLGRALSQDLIRRATELKYHVLIAGICTEQTASLRLHKSLGYVQVGHFCEVGRKFDRWLDVAYLQLTLPRETNAAED